jgi:hypothetical protein
MTAAVMVAQMPPLFESPSVASMYPSLQIIEDRYIDDCKLLKICRERFGQGNYRLKVHGLLHQSSEDNKLKLSSTSSTSGTSGHPPVLTKYDFEPPFYLK